MFKKITAILVMLLCCIMLVPATVSNAATNDFFTSYPEPATSDSQGYVTVLIANKNDASDMKIATFFWSVYAVDNGCLSAAIMDISIKNDTVNFNIMQNGATGVFYSLSMVTIANHYRLSIATGSSSFSYNLGAEGYSIKGWKSGGNCAVRDFWNNVSFSVYFSNTSQTILLRQLIDAVDTMRVQYIVTEGSHGIEFSQMNDNLQSILNSSNSIATKIQSIYELQVTVDGKLTDIRTMCVNYFPEIASKIDALISEQKKTNTWLEKIFDYLQESQEKQKQEAETQGNNSTKKGMDAIEDKGGDFAGSLSGLTNSMSYTGTKCAWEFPQVKLPAISGVMDEMILIEKQPIDFAVWVNAIPSDILLVVQSLCTAGLIIYCFKELYDTIAYVLTLRKDDNS